METSDNMQEDQMSAWNRLKGLKDKKVPLSNTGKATLATAIGAPVLLEGVAHMGNIGLGISGAAVILSFMHGEKAFRVSKWLKEKIVDDNNLRTHERPQERIVEDDKPRLQPEKNVFKNDFPRLSPESNEDSLQLSSALSVHADDFLAERKLIVGVSGSGKSNSVAVICEELGELDVPFVLFDTENEYESLCDEKYLTCWQRLDSSNLNTDNAVQWASYILDNNVQAIVNLQDYDMEAAAWIMINMIEGLTTWQEARPNDERIPCEIILEEATTWLPQNTGESQLEKATLSALQSAFFNDVVRKGRKRGLGFTAVCQKIAELDKRALQCRVKILHGQSELKDLERYKAMGISSEETLSLRGGQAFVWVGRIAKQLVQMRLRRSPHGAKTPTLASLRNRQTRPVEKPVQSTAVLEPIVEVLTPAARHPSTRLPTVLEEALKYYNEGCTSSRLLAARMRVGKDTANGYIRQLKERKLIV